jgi:hypothetical protein
MQCTAAEPLGEARFCQAIYADIAADASMYLLASKDQQTEFEDHINKNGAKLSVHPWEAAQVRTLPLCAQPAST